MISLKNSLVSLVVSTQMPSSRQDMHQLLCIPASLTFILSLNKYLFMEYSVSKGRWNLACRPYTRNTSRHLETEE